MLAVSQGYFENADRLTPSSQIFRLYGNNVREDQNSFCMGAITKKFVSEEDGSSNFMMSVGAPSSRGGLKIFGEVIVPFKDALHRLFPVAGTCNDFFSCSVTRCFAYFQGQSITRFQAPKDYEEEEEKEEKCRGSKKAARRPSSKAC